MTFEEKVKFVRALPEFKVIPISEVRAIAFVVREAYSSDSIVLEHSSKSLFISAEDAQKIVREYPDLASKLILE